jgi:phosphatidate cytidylyltransferase
MPWDQAKVRRIWKRTWIGASMISTLAVILWLASRPGGERVILWTGVLLAVGCAFELARMRAILEGRIPYATLAAILSTAVCIEAQQIGPSSSFRAIGGLMFYTYVYANACLIAFVFLFTKSWRARTSVEQGKLVNNAWIGLFLSLWIALPLPWTAIVRAVYGIWAMSALVLLSKIGDMAGLYVGSAIGRTHPFPKISPGKTVAGCVGSFVAAVVTGGVLQWLEWLPVPRLGVATGFLTGALLNVAAQAGDLLKSFVKRRSGVKDSGRVFGPAGGVLDMVDSLLLTVPCALFSWPLLYELPG